MNKLKRILLLLVVIVSSPAYAQSEFIKMLMETEKTPVVLADIEADVLTPSSPYYYPILYARYEKGDTTLNLEDYRHLYYGYMFNEDYQPHKEPIEVDSLSQVINNDGGVFSDLSTGKIVGYLDKILAARPFSLKFLNMMTYVYDEKVRNPEKALEYSYKFNMLLSAIFSSGDGTKDSPWLVLYRADAQTVLQSLGAKVAQRHYITTNVEYYFLEERQGDRKGYYFDFDPIYTRPAEPKGKRKLEVNPQHNPKSDSYINQKNK